MSRLCLQIREYDADTDPCQKGQTTLPSQTWHGDSSSQAALNLMAHRVHPGPENVQREISRGG